MTCSPRSTLNIVLETLSPWSLSVSWLCLDWTNSRKTLSPKSPEFYLQMFRCKLYDVTSVLSLSFSAVTGRFLGKNIVLSDEPYLSY